MRLRDYFDSSSNDPFFVLPYFGKRLQRVIYYCQAARGASDIGVKISFYITCFEALYSTDPSELSHKLSERMALFLAENVEQRFIIYKNVKRAYAIRSKTVHGSDLGDRGKLDVESVSVNCDKMLRQSLLKILPNEDMLDLFSGDDAKIEEYMLKLIFT
jgi:hypothetical protein